MNPRVDEVRLIASPDEPAPIDLYWAGQLDEQDTRTAEAIERLSRQLSTVSRVLIGVLSTTTAASILLAANVLIGKELNMKVIEWIKSKTLTLSAAVAMILNGGNLFEWWNLDADELAWVNGAFALFLVLIVGGTVTANARLGAGEVWGGLNGKQPGEG